VYWSIRSIIENCGKSRKILNNLSKLFQKAKGCQIARLFKTRKDPRGLSEIDEDYAFEELQNVPADTGI